MKISTKMKEHAALHFGVAADATDEDVQTALLKAVASGDMEMADIVALEKEDAPVEEKSSVDKLQQLGDIIGKAVETAVASNARNGSR